MIKSHRVITFGYPYIGYPPLNNNKLHKNAITPATRLGRGIPITVAQQKIIQEAINPATHSSKRHPTTVDQQQITQERVIFY